MPAAASSLRWPSLAVLLPLVALGVLAWLGSRAQVRAAWSSAKEESKGSAVAAADYLSRSLAEAVQTTPLFPEPPLPGSASPADEVLDSEDLEAHRSLRTNEAAGLSPAGLPRRVLAGFRILEKTGDPSDAAILVELATRDEPSILTPLAFEKAGDMAKDWPKRWLRGDQARAIVRKHPDPGSVGRWITDKGETWWFSRNGRDLRFLDPNTLRDLLTSTAKRLPAWADIRVSSVDRVLAGNSTTGELMQDVPVSFTGDLRLEIIAARPALFEASAREQSRWTLGLLSLSLIVSVGSLGLIHRTVQRERQLNAMKSQFVASVSHELRAPVASIRLMADALEAEKVDPETAKEFHRLIAREGARLSTLIGNVLDHARIEQGRRVWKMEPSDLAGLVADTLRVMEPLAEERNITLTSELEQFEASVDTCAIQQALVNLLDNAIKFSPPGSTVTIALSIYEKRSSWKLSVRDAGPGIALSEQSRIFERFHRLGDELRRETQGTGIGLSLVKSIVEAHRGTIAVESSPGDGSTFNLIVPLSP